MTAIITSTANPRIKAVAALRDRKERNDQSRMLVEGNDELAVALSSRIKPIALYFCPKLFGGEDARARTLLREAELAGADLIELGEGAFAKCAYRGTGSDGLLGVFEQPSFSLNAITVTDNPVILVIDSVEKPGNLGAMLRTADAVGVSAVICCDPATDLANPNVIRASKGAVFVVQVAVCSAPLAQNWLAALRIRIITASPAANKSYIETDLTGGVALVVGEEKHGLGREWLGLDGEHVSIPMRGRVNSLNVATSAAILLYEAARQRDVPGRIVGQHA